MQLVGGFDFKARIYFPAFLRLQLVLSQPQERRLKPILEGRPHLPHWCLAQQGYQRPSLHFFPLP